MRPIHNIGKGESVRGDQESIQLSGAYATNQQAWRRRKRRGRKGDC
jgi:hypothetical protein